MVEDLTLSNDDESNFANVLQKNINEFYFISSLYNSPTDNFKQCKTYEASNQLPLTEKKLIYFAY